MTAPEKDYAKLLSRGGAGLSLAACAVAEEPQPLIRWNVLASSRAAQADGIIEAIESGVSPRPSPRR